MDPCAQSVDHQLCYTDEDGSNALVTDAQNLFTVAAGDDVNIIRWAPPVKYVLNLLRLADIEKAPFWLSEYSAVV